MTFAELKAEVNANLIDTPTVVSTNLGLYVNRAIRSLQRKRNWAALQASADYVTTEGVALLGTRPARFKGYRGTPFTTYFIDQRTRPLTFVSSLTGFSQAVGFTEIGEPRFIYEAPIEDGTGAASLSVGPLPDGTSDWADGEYRITVPHWAYLADLSDDTDENWFSTEASDYIVYRATGEGFHALEDEDRAMIWEARAERQYPDIVKTDAMKWFSAVNTLATSTGAYGPRTME